MSYVQPFCIICRKSNGKLKTFEEKILCKCAEISKIRQDNNLIISEVVVPKEVNELQRYHTFCYRRFTALPKKYRVSSSKPAVESSPSTSQYVY